MNFLFELNRILLAEELFYYSFIEHNDINSDYSALADTETTYLLTNYKFSKN